MIMVMMSRRTMIGRKIIILMIVMSNSLIMCYATHCRVYLKNNPCKRKDQGLTQKICFFQTNKIVKINFCVNRASND